MVSQYLVSFWSPYIACLRGHDTLIHGSLKHIYYVDTEQFKFFYVTFYNEVSEIKNIKFPWNSVSLFAFECILKHDEDFGIPWILRANAHIIQPKCIALRARQI